MGSTPVLPDWFAVVVIALGCGSEGKRRKGQVTGKCSPLRTGLGLCHCESERGREWQEALNQSLVGFVWGCRSTSRGVPRVGSGW